jgi:transposase
MMKLEITLESERRPTLKDWLQLIRELIRLPFLVIAKTIEDMRRLEMLRKALDDGKGE